MTNLKERLLNYLETLSGERADLAVEAGSALPLFLRERDAIFLPVCSEGSLCWRLKRRTGKSDHRANTGSTKRLFKLKFSESVVLVLPILPSYASNRMVQIGIPFIVPDIARRLPPRFTPECFQCVVALLRMESHDPAMFVERKRPVIAPVANCPHTDLVARRHLVARLQ